MVSLHHFSPSEFRCGCGECGKGFESMQRDLLLRLDKARRIAGIPFVLTSSIRCPAWNEKVGGVDSSAHLEGWAVDVSATASGQRYEIVRAALEAGFRRIGIADSFVHMDCDPSKPADVIWTY